jgi:hypothetical protein
LKGSLDPVSKLGDRWELMTFEHVMGAPEGASLRMLDTISSVMELDPFSSDVTVNRPYKSFDEVMRPVETSRPPMDDDYMGEDEISGEKESEVGGARPDRGQLGPIKSYTCPTYFEWYQNRHDDPDFNPALCDDSTTCYGCQGLVVRSTWKGWANKVNGKKLCNACWHPGKYARVSPTMKPGCVCGECNIDDDLYSDDSDSDDDDNWSDLVGWARSVTGCLPGQSFPTDIHRSMVLASRQHEDARRANRRNNTDPQCWDWSV